MTDKKEPVEPKEPPVEPKAPEEPKTAEPSSSPIPTLKQWVDGGYDAQDYPSRWHVAETIDGVPAHLTAEGGATAFGPGTPAK